mgnify:CR=1 FL=1
MAVFAGSALLLTEWNRETCAEVLVPLLLIVGVGLFQKAARPEWRQAGRILIGLQHLQSPTELYTLKTDGRDLKQITDLNGAQPGRAVRPTLVKIDSDATRLDWFVDTTSTQDGELGSDTPRAWNDESLLDDAMEIHGAFAASVLTPTTVDDFFAATKVP